MSTTAKPASKRSSLRILVPLAILLLSGTGLAVLWTYPGDSPPVEARRFFSGIIGGLTALTLVLWTFAILSWKMRAVFLGTLAFLGLATLGLVKEFRVSRHAQFIPGIIFRWEKSDDDRLEEHRQGQKSAEDTVALTEKRTDFPEYRGRKRDGIVLGPPLNRDWTARPPRPVWRQPIGGGYAAFAVVGNLAVTIEQRRDQESVVGYDTATGRERWRHSYPAHFKEALGGPGPRATPTISGGDVFSLGATGHLVCLDAATGKDKWAVDILYDNANLQWGMSGSPLVYDNLVVVNPGTQTKEAEGRAVVAYDRATGKEVWRSGSNPAGYSSPMLATLAGKRQVLLLDGTGLSGYDPATGKELWRHPWVTYTNINVAQPIVVDSERVLISAGYNHGSALVKVAQKDGQWTVTQVWFNPKAMLCKFTSPVLYQGHVYGITDAAGGILQCVDVETGKEKWRDGRYGHGQLLLSGDLLVVMTEDSKLALVEATPEKWKELGKFQALEGAKTWNLPAMQNGKVFIRNEDEMACYDLAETETKP